MIILEKPYVSEFLQQTVVRLQIPVQATPFSKSLKYANEMNFVENDAFLLRLKPAQIRCCTVTQKILPNYWTVTDRNLQSRSDKVYGMFGIDIPKYLDKNKIRFDYERFIAHFSKPLYYVKLDYTTFPMAIYLFAEVQKNRFSEFESILYSDLSEFIERKE